MRHSGQFSNYNFREYARRKTKDSFREHQHTTEERQVQELMQEGLQSLRLLKVSYVTRCLGKNSISGILGLDFRSHPLEADEYHLATLPYTPLKHFPELFKLTWLQRQTIVSQFFQLDKLVVEGQKTVGLV